MQSSRISAAHFCRYCSISQINLYSIQLHHNNLWWYEYKQHHLAIDENRRRGKNKEVFSDFCIKIVQASATSQDSNIPAPETINCFNAFL